MEAETRHKVQQAWQGPGSGAGWRCLDPEGSSVLQAGSPGLGHSQVSPPPGAPAGNSRVLEPWALPGVGAGLPTLMSAARPRATVQNTRDSECTRASACGLDPWPHQALKGRLPVRCL